MTQTTETQSDLVAELRELANRKAATGHIVTAYGIDTALDIAARHEQQWQAECDRLRAENKFLESQMHQALGRASDRLISLSEARRERDALAAFKTFVHRRLDTAGVPTHPDGPHSQEGCRIGDRLDILVSDRDEAQDVFAGLHASALRLASDLEQKGYEQFVHRSVGAAEIYGDVAARIMALLAAGEGDAGADDGREPGGEGGVNREKKDEVP